MAKPEGLAKRGTRYFVRVRVPDRLRPIVDKREIVKALGTSDRAEALVRLRRARVEIDSLFLAAQRTSALARQRPAGTGAGTRRDLGRDEGMACRERASDAGHAAAAGYGCRAVA